jgi:hypothetical protein
MPADSFPRQQDSATEIDFTVSVVELEHAACRDHGFVGSILPSYPETAKGVAWAVFLCQTPEWIFEL